MDYEYNILEEKFKRLPKDIQRALTSTEVSAEVKKISVNNGLHIDQESVLFDLISYVLLGLLPSNQFVKTFSKEAHVTTDVAEKVAVDVNAEVFDKIRSSMRQIQERESMTQNHQDLSALERAGGFSVEPSLASTSADGEESMADSEDVQESDKNDILAGIENPKPSPSMSTPKPEETHTEPLVDHLLGNSNSQTEQKIVHKTEEPPANLPITEETPTSSVASIPIKPSTPPVRPAPQPRKGPDPYRESFN